jgi:hypothetical protein
MTRLIILLLLAMVLMPAADIEPRSYTALTPELRALVPVGSARTAKDIDASPFGTHTTVIAEGGDTATVARLPALIAAAGYTWVVDYVSPGRMEGLSPASAVERWNRQAERALAYATALNQCGVHMLVRLDPLPWQRMHPGQPSEEQLQGGVAVMTQAVRALKHLVRHWQIWNEPNLGNADPVVPPELYIRVAAAMSAAIRAEQPEAVIYGPGTAMLQCMDANPYPWIDRALEAGLMRYIDVFSYHPYRQPYWRSNLPEHASEFYPWAIWGSYEVQITDLRARLAKAAGRAVPLAVTEDGVPSFITSDGEQHLPPVVVAKYELRRSLLDAWLGVSPRVHFCFWRQMTNHAYESEASFNTLVGAELQPVYYAAQNLHGILDGGHQPWPACVVEPRLDSPGPAVRIQTWRKQIAGCEEILVAFWAEEESGTVHRRHPASLRIVAPGAESPRLFDLMAMPAPRGKGGMIDLMNPEYRPRKAPREPAIIGDAAGVEIRDIEIRDYPQILQLVRFNKP